MAAALVVLGAPNKLGALAGVVVGTIAGAETVDGVPKFIVP